MSRRAPPPTQANLLDEPLIDITTPATQPPLQPYTSTTPILTPSTTTAQTAPPSSQHPVAYPTFSDTNPRNPPQNTQPPPPPERTPPSQRPQHQENQPLGVFTGPLPPDFLRLVPPPAPVLPPVAPSLPSMPYAASYGPPQPPPGLVRTLFVEVLDGKFKKNHGFTPMSLYCKLRVADAALITNTHEHGGTTPSWNTRLRFVLGANSPQRLYLEVYDTGFFSDDRIAWAEVSLEEVYATNEEHVKHVELTSKDGKVEGQVKLVLIVQLAPMPVQVQHVMRGDGVYYTQSRQIPVSGHTVQQAQAIAAQQQQQQHQMAAAKYEQQQAEAAVHMEKQKKAADMTSLKAMFPQFDDDIIGSVYDSNGNSVDRTVSALLAMSG